MSRGYRDADAGHTVLWAADSQPIVCSPRDAIRCFWTTDIDVLAIGNRLVYKNGADVK